MYERKKNVCNLSVCSDLFRIDWGKKKFLSNFGFVSRKQVFINHIQYWIIQPNIQITQIKCVRHESQLLTSIAMMNQNTTAFTLTKSLRLPWIRLSLCLHIYAHNHTVDWLWYAKQLQLFESSNVKRVEEITLNTETCLHQRPTLCPFSRLILTFIYQNKFTIRICCLLILTI